MQLADQSLRNVVAHVRLPSLHCDGDAIVATKLLDYSITCSACGCLRGEKRTEQSEDENKDRQLEAEQGGRSSKGKEAKKFASTTQNPPVEAPTARQRRYQKRREKALIQASKNKR